MKGSYVLIIELPKAQTITIGRLGTTRFQCGYYAYVGSAMNGFKSRLNHHLRRNKKPHWHIDYLLEKAYLSEIILYEAKDRAECAIAQILSHQFGSVLGFGSSDCRCQSHLFFTTDQMKAVIIAALDSLPEKEVIK